MLGKCMERVVFNLSKAKHGLEDCNLIVVDTVAAAENHTGCHSHHIRTTGYNLPRITKTGEQVIGNPLWESCAKVLERRVHPLDEPWMEEEQCKSTTSINFLPLIQVTVQSMG